MLLVLLLLLAADAPRFVLQHEDALGEATWLDTATHGHRRYTVNDGLPDPSIQAIATDHEGRLWIGTQDGAALFNGTAWRPLELQTKLRSTEVRRVLRGKDGAMYVGTFGGGLVRKTRAGETLIDQRRGLADNEVRALAEDDRGALWIATSSALNVLAGDAVTVARPVDVAIDAICVSGGEIFVPIGKELQRYASADRRPTGAAIPLGDAVRSCLASDDGSVWLGGETSLMRVKDGAVERFGKDALGTVQFYALAEGTVRGERTLWAGTQNGELVTYARGRFSKRTLVSSAISALAFTSLGVPLLWVGSQEGIVRQNLGGWRAFPSGPAFLRQRTKGIVEDGRGRLWIGTALGLGVADKTRTSFFTANAALGDSHIFSMKRDADGEVLVGTRKGFLFASTEGGFRTLPLALEPFQSIQTLGRLASGALFVGTRNGYYLLERGGEPEHIDAARGLVGGGMVYAVAERVEKTGGTELWIATDSALNRRRNGRFTHFGEKDGLPSDNVNALLALPERGPTEAMWIGTNGGGALRVAFDKETGEVRERRVFDTQSTPAIPNNILNGIAADRDGRVYLFTNRGVARVDDRSVRTFTAEDGLAADETTIGAALIDAQGRVWAGTTAGVSVLDPKEDVADTVAKPLLIERVLVNGAERAELGALDHDEDHLRFEYALLSYFKPDATLYRSQLVPAEAKATPWSHETSRELSALRPGGYTLKIWAKDYAGNLSGPAALAFTIAPPPWLTWWAYAIYAACAGAVVFSGVRVRERTLKRRAEELETLVHARTQELEESYKQADRIFAQLKEALKGNLLDEKYRLQNELGHGGFGVVYQAEEVRSGRKLAVKVFRPSAGNESAEALERFKLEAKSGQRLKHEHIVAIEDFGVSKDNIAYLVMELLTGQTLKQALRARGKLPLAECRDVALAVAKALAAAHAIGIVHRDIKPDNIFLQEAGGHIVPKVLDFGVAKVQASAALSVELRTLTLTGNVVGTPTYMAPERLEDRPYDGRSDIYSVGIMLYEMLVGQPPFLSSNDNLFSIVMQHLQTAPAPLVGFDPTIPPAVERAVLHALAKDPEARPTAAAFIVEIEAAFGA